MTDDIVTRLRKLELALMCNGADGHGFLIKHAADEIEHLRKELEIYKDLYAELAVKEQLNK